MKKKRKEKKRKDGALTILITGPTASGKTAVAYILCKLLRESGHNVLLKQNYMPKEGVKISKEHTDRWDSNFSKLRSMPVIIIDDAEGV